MPTDAEIEEFRRLWYSMVNDVTTNNREWKHSISKEGPMQVMELDVACIDKDQVFTTIPAGPAPGSAGAGYGVWYLVVGSSTGPTMGPWVIVGGFVNEFTPTGGVRGTIKDPWSVSPLFTATAGPFESWLDEAESWLDSASSMDHSAEATAAAIRVMEVSQAVWVAVHSSFSALSAALDRETVEIEHEKAALLDAVKLVKTRAERSLSHEKLKREAITELAVDAIRGKFDRHITIEASDNSVQREAFQRGWHEAEAQDRVTRMTRG